MPHKLSAIDIAEGALLADIAVIFHLLAHYLPIGGEFFRLLIPIVYAVLVLRRSFYTGIMGLCVAIFLISMLTGPGPVAFMLLEGGAGLFLGLTMKYRLPHLLLIFIGVTSGALTVYILFFIGSFLFGFPVATFVKNLQMSYINLLAFGHGISTSIGLGSIWKQAIYPLASRITPLIIPYWALFFFLGIWIALCPVVILVYYLTNFFVRLLGYQVRPFPGGFIERILQRILRRLIRIAIKQGVIRRHKTAL